MTFTEYKVETERLLKSYGFNTKEVFYIMVNRKIHATYDEGILDPEEFAIGFIFDYDLTMDNRITSMKL